MVNLGEIEPTRTEPARNDVMKCVNWILNIVCNDEPEQPF